MKNGLKNYLKSILIVQRAKRFLTDFHLPPFILYPYYKIKFSRLPASGLRLHLGCGTIHKKGYINIDHRFTNATDMVCDINKLPFPTGSVECIESYHVIEHIPHPQVPDLLKECRRVLEPGGKLVLEFPDFDNTIREYLEGNESRIYNVFGWQRFPGDAHLFGYNQQRITEVLENSGFKEIVMAEPIDYHKDLEPCMRVECVRG